MKITLTRVECGPHAPYEVSVYDGHRLVVYAARSGPVRIEVEVDGGGLNVEWVEEGKLVIRSGRG